MSFRQRSIAVTTPHHEALKAYAAAHGLEGPDAAAELLLGRFIQGDPLLVGCDAEYRKVMTDLQKRRLEKINASASESDLRKRGQARIAEMGGRV